jgi:hypothetical protein
MNYWNIIKCFIRHKWVYKKEKSSQFQMLNYQTYEYEREIRICERCFLKEKRYHYTGDDDFDWLKCSLNKDELRDKKIKELGI